MVKILVKTTCLLVLLLVLFCACSKRTDTVKQSAKASDISAEELDLIIQEKIKISPVLAIKFEKYATDVLQDQVEKIRKEKEILGAEVGGQIKEKQILIEGNEILREDKKKLSQQVLELSQERDQLKQSNSILPAYQQRISELENNILLIKSQQNQVQPQEKQIQESSSVISNKNERNRLVPVLISASAEGVGTHTVIRAYFKITDKKTGKFFVYEIRSSFTKGDLPIISQIINISPGEYIVQVSKPYNRNYLPSAPQTFVVSEEPIGEVKGKKIHALVDY